jgi:hypothetical protein
MQKGKQKSNNQSIPSTEATDHHEASALTKAMAAHAARHESPPKQPKDILFIFASQKGGVGKSFLSSTLVEYLQYGCEQPMEVLIIDCDTRNRTLTKRYGSESHVPDCPSRSLMTLSLTNRDDVDKLFAAVENGPRFVLMDLPAADESSLRKIFPNARTMDTVFAALGYRVCIVLPITSQAETDDAAHNMLGLFGASVDYLLICNPFGNKSQSSVEENFKRILASIPSKGKNVIAGISNVLDESGHEDIERHTGVPFSLVPMVLMNEGRRANASVLLRGGIIDAFLETQHDFWDKMVRECLVSHDRRIAQGAKS